MKTESLHFSCRILLANKEGHSFSVCKLVVYIMQRRNTTEGTVCCHAHGYFITISAWRHQDDTRQKYSALKVSARVRNYLDKKETNFVQLYAFSAHSMSTSHCLNGDVILGQHGREFREGCDAMVRAWCFANVAAWPTVLNPAWCRILREILCFSPLNIVILFRCCVLRQYTLPSHASLDSGVKRYLDMRTEMAMCTISSMRQNGCRTLSSPCS